MSRQAWKSWAVVTAVFTVMVGVAVFAQAQQSQQQVPDAYYQLMGRANYAFQNATSTADYAAAVKLFQQAADAAPWLPDTYYNLGKAQEKAKQFNDAIRSLQRYLDLKPNAADRDKVHAEIEELQGEAQQASEQPSAEQKEQQQQAALELTWTDPATGLMWARQDNGSDVNWQQATNYCQNLTLAGYSDWRLPTIDELAAIYDPAQNVSVTNNLGNWTVHIREGISLTSCCAWSSSDGNASGQAWVFFFDDGSRDSYVLRNVYTRRALCVRGS